MDFKVDDLVNITDEHVKKVYGLSDKDIFTVVSIKPCNDYTTVLLNNGFIIRSNHLKLEDSNSHREHNEDEVEDLVVSELAMKRMNHEMFTVYDITRSIRNKEPNLDIRHDFVKSIVENEIEDGFLENYDYERTLIDVGAAIQPWLYYPAGADISQYDKNSKSSKVNKNSFHKVTAYFEA
jgi:hypothetical protein